MLQDSHPAGYMLRCHGYLTPENSQQTHRPAWAETRRLSRAKSLPSLCRYQTAVMATFEQAKTYLTDLSMVAREHILRFLSKRPHSRRWGCYVDDEVVTSFVSEMNPLSPCTSEKLQDLWRSWISRPESPMYQVPRDGLNMYQIRHASHFFRTQSQEDFDLSFSCFDFKAYHLEKSAQGFFWTYVLVKLREKVDRESTEAKKLEIITKCLFQFGGRSKLKCQDIKIDLRLRSELHSSFTVVGRTLELLTFEVSAQDEHLNVPHFNIGTLVYLCPHLKHLCIEYNGSSDQLRNKVEGLFYSYGEKLRFIGLSGRERVSFQENIGFRCPKAVFDFYGATMTPESVLSILGAKIRPFTWMPVHFNQELEPASLDSVASRCFNIEGLTISNTVGLKPWSSAFFQAQKPKLRKLVLVSTHGDEVSATVAFAATNTGALEEVRISCRHIEADALEKLACANSLLEILCFEIHKRLQTRDMVDLISCFVGCNKLRSLSINSDESIRTDSEVQTIRNASVQFRTRNVSVQVNEVEYI